MGEGKEQKSFEIGELPPWRAVIYDGYSSGLAEGVRAFFRLAIAPACEAIQAELDATPRGPDDPSHDEWDRLRDTQLELHRSFALVLGAMWERHFRQHLVISPERRIRFRPPPGVRRVPVGNMGKYLMNALKSAAAVAAVVTLAFAATPTFANHG